MFEEDLDQSVGGGVIIFSMSAEVWFLTPFFSISQANGGKKNIIAPPAKEKMILIFKDLSV